jgi:hypothetical protein
VRSLNATFRDLAVVSFTANWVLLQGDSVTEIDKIYATGQYEIIRCSYSRKFHTRCFIILLFLYNLTRTFKPKHVVPLISGKILLSVTKFTVTF